MKVFKSFQQQLSQKDLRNHYLHRGKSNRFENKAAKRWKPDTDHNTVYFVLSIEKLALKYG